jgi:hypothetical protein
MQEKKKFDQKHAIGVINRRDSFGTTQTFSKKV